MWKKFRFFFAPDDGKGGGGGGSNEPPTSLQITIGDETKTVTAEEVAKLLGEHSQLSQQLSEAQGIFEMSKNFGIKPSEFAQEAEGAFQMLNELINAGVIDQSGKPIEQKPSVEPPVHPDERKFKQNEPGFSQGSLEAALEKALAPMREELEEVKKDRDLLYRERYKDRLKADHKLSEDQAERVLSDILTDRRKSPDQHIKDFLNSEATRSAELREKYAKEFGIDLESWEKKNAEERLVQEGGLGAAIIGNKKVSFKAKSGDPNAIHPRDAAAEMLKRAQDG